MSESALSIYADHSQGFVSLRYHDALYTKNCKWSEQYTQAAGFVPLLQSVIDLAPNAFVSDVIIAPKGPSSFTTLRITLAVAKSIQFCMPNAKVFAPSNFEIAAFALRESLTKNTPFLVLLDAFRVGFYAAILEWKGGALIPQIVLESAFYGAEDGEAFLKNHETVQMITNFSEQSFGSKFLNGLNSEILFLPNVDFATTQIELYDAMEQIPLDYSNFSPLYLHMPNYTKVSARMTV